MFKFINFKIFFIVLVVGIFINYLRGSSKKIVYKFPTPENNNIVYNTNNDDICFKFNSRQVNCDENSFGTPIIEN